ncbi:MAG: hypothetical protein RMJ43_06510 [Chloroherpetonaceae bacterium]|nr:hypothetical protein [Chthonomonadaceae bacterium]MDW8207471.1 hypothetical protein [Chloroherpetonaceae bacterium]
MPGPLEAYRHTQRALRQAFDAFTRTHCPNCPTPCCRRPARILPTDILLAESTGWRAHLPGHTRQDPVIQTGASYLEALRTPVQTADSSPDTPDLPCEFLGPRGCTFPPDLRPFGCTTYICQHMYARLPRRELARIKRLVRTLEHQHVALLRALRPISWKDSDPGTADREPAQAP